MAARDARFAVLRDWLTRIVASESFRVVPLDGRAAVVAGRLRGEVPHPPARRNRDGRSKTMRQAPWLLDVEIAAIAFAAGLDVATENRADFERIGSLLNDLYPTAPPLAVLDPPV